MARFVGLTLQRYAIFSTQAFRCYVLRRHETSVSGAFQSKSGVTSSSDQRSAGSGKSTDGKSNKRKKDGSTREVKEKDIDLSVFKQLTASRREFATR